MLEQYDLHNLLVIDIETVPQYSSFDQVPENFQKLWDLKTQNQRKEETAEVFYERAGIWAEFGKIICISVGIFVNGKQTSLRVKSFASHSEKEVLEKFDHRNLNLDTIYFKDLNPTAEHIAIVIYDLLRARIDPKLELQVRLYETERNFVEYPA